MQKLKIIGTALFLTFTTMSLAIAGNFEVSPVRVTLTQKAAITAITLRNQGENPVLIQVNTSKWDAGEVYTPTQDILVNPMIFTVKPGESQIVRIAATDLKNLDKEMSYRIFFTEVPKALKHVKSGIQVALKIGIPVFILPQKSNPLLKWSANKTTSGGLQINLANLGNTHAQIIDLALASSSKKSEPLAKKKVYEYILPGQSAKWSIPAKEIVTNGHWGSGKAYLSASTDSGVIHDEIEVKGL